MMVTEDKIHTRIRVSINNSWYVRVWLRSPHPSLGLVLYSASKADVQSRRNSFTEILCENMILCCLGYTYAVRHRSLLVYSTCFYCYVHGVMVCQAQTHAPYSACRLFSYATLQQVRYRPQRRGMSEHTSLQTCRHLYLRVFTQELYDIVYYKKIYLT